MAAETVAAGSVAGSVEATLLIETVVLTSKASVTAGTVVAAGTVKRTVETAGPIEAAAGTVLVVAAGTVAEDATVYTTVTKTVSMEASVTGTVDGRPARSRFVHEARLHFRVPLLVVGSDEAVAAVVLVAVRVAFRDSCFAAQCWLLSSGLLVPSLTYLVAALVAVVRIALHELSFVARCRLLSSWLLVPSLLYLVPDALRHFRVPLLVVGSDKAAAAALGAAFRVLFFGVRCCRLSSWLHVQPLPTVFCWGFWLSLQLAFSWGSVCGEPCRCCHFLLTDCVGA